MSRDIKLIALLRQVARSKKVSGRRRLAAIDQLAAIDNVYHLTDGAPFVETPKYALTTVRRLLVRLIEDVKIGRIASQAVDRIAFIRGRNIEGLFRVVPPQTVTKSPVSTNPVEDLLAKVAALKAKNGGNNGN